MTRLSHSRILQRGSCGLLGAKTMVLRGKYVPRHWYPTSGVFFLFHQEPPKGFFACSRTVFPLCRNIVIGGEDIKLHLVTGTCSLAVAESLEVPTVDGSG